MNRKYEPLHIIYCLKVGAYLKKIYWKEAKKELQKNGVLFLKEITCRLFCFYPINLITNYDTSKMIYLSDPLFTIIIHSILAVIINHYYNIICITSVQYFIYSFVHRFRRIFVFPR